jgi:hypothetical protein
MVVVVCRAGATGGAASERGGVGVVPLRRLSVRSGARCQNE